MYSEPHGGAPTTLDHPAARIKHLHDVPSQHLVRARGVGVDSSGLPFALRLGAVRASAAARSRPASAGGRSGSTGGPDTAVRDAPLIGAASGHLVGTAAMPAPRRERSWPAPSR